MKPIDKTKISSAIVELAQKQLKLPLNVNLNVSLVMELGVDSLDIVELIMAIEKEFNIQFPDSVNKKLRTLQDFIENTIILVAPKE